MENLQYLYSTPCITQTYIHLVRPHIEYARGHGDELQVGRVFWSSVSQQRKNWFFLTFYWQVMPIKTRSKKGEEEITSAGDSACLLENLSKKLDDMNTTQERRHEELCSKLEGLEQKTSTLVTELKELKEGLQFLENDLADVKQDVETKADKVHVLELESRITDLQNRSRRQ